MMSPCLPDVDLLGLCTPAERGAAVQAHRLEVLGSLNHVAERNAAAAHGRDALRAQNARTRLDDTLGIAPRFRGQASAHAELQRIDNPAAASILGPMAPAWDLLAAMSSEWHGANDPDAPSCTITSGGGTHLLNKRKDGIEEHHLQSNKRISLRPSTLDAHCKDHIPR